MGSPGLAAGACCPDAILPPGPPSLTGPPHSQLGPTAEPRLWGLCPPLLGGRVFYPLVIQVYFLHWNKNLPPSISLDRLELRFLAPTHMSDFSQNPSWLTRSGPAASSPAHGRYCRAARGVWRCPVAQAERSSFSAVPCPALLVEARRTTRLGFPAGNLLLLWHWCGNHLEVLHKPLT